MNKLFRSVVLVFGLSTFLAEGQTQPVLKIQRSDPDVLKVIEWSSETNAMYRVEYSVGLTNWILAQEDIPSQGTNTFWLDAGHPSDVSYRPLSIDPDSPYRFYRVTVQEYTSNNASISVTISNLTTGSVLSSITNVYASSASSNEISSARILVDGEKVGDSPGTNYTFAINTHFYPNGIHRISVIAEDNGDYGTTGGEETVNNDGTGASYGCKNLSVIFSNLCSNVRLRYPAFRPDLGQTQEVYATWSTPRIWQVDFCPKGDSNTVHRSFSGEGTKIVVLWDGKDSGSNELSAQLISCYIYDLGEGSGGGGGGGGGIGEDPPPPGGFAGGSWEPQLPPVPWDTNSWWGASQETSSQPASRSTATYDSSTGGAALNSFSPESIIGVPIEIIFPHKAFGSFGCLYQGHHPVFGSYPRPPRGLPFGQVTFTAGNGPWGKLKSPKKIAKELEGAFPPMGYFIKYIEGDDQVSAGDLQKGSLGGNGTFNSATISLYIGHSGAGKENIVALAHPQTYIPIYNNSSDTMSWVGMNDMRLGSSNLKWAAFLSCNMFRDSAYRSFGSYAQMKNNNHLGITTDLHIMQAYATEVLVHPSFGKWWNKALLNDTGVAEDATVVGAWNYACRLTQGKETAANVNYCRSACWPECIGDYIYGYGPQTDPDPDRLQGELVEIDDHPEIIP